MSNVPGANVPCAANGRPTESVWDYPRPPAVEREQRRVKVLHEGLVVAESDRALRVLETASPPGIYLPPEDVVRELLEPAEGHTVCEWKGLASYFDVVGGGVRSERAAWAYPQPNPDYTELGDYIAFNAGRVEGYLGEE